MHKPVLLHESIEALNLKVGKSFLDGTFGNGGHTKEVLRRFGNKIRIICIDQDSRAVNEARSLDVEIKKENFCNLTEVLKGFGILSVDAILFDLGISSNQLENSGKGFTFLKNEPLDMRMSSEGLKASDLLNSWDESALELIIRGFGEEKFSKKIAQEIVGRRKSKSFETTFDLVDAVLAVKPKSWRDKIHPATKTFQALRLATNDELPSLEKGLEKGFKVLNRNGRFAVISFHSLEDRIVKNFFRNKILEKVALQVTKKPITPNKEEIESNPRARSAKLRVIEKI